jgi:PAS domain-containing protein
MVGADSPLRRSIEYTSALSLSHDQNVFSLEFSALSYFNPVTNRYRYKLDGLDRQWHEVGSNQRLATYTTLPASLDSGWQASIHPDDLDEHLSKWRTSLATGVPFENKARHRDAHGAYRWFLVRAVPLQDGHGNVLKWYGTMTDIEDRNRAEQEREKVR